MIEFDYEAAKHGRKVMTDSNIPCRIISFDAQLRENKEPKMIVLLNHGGYETILTFNKNGTSDDTATIKLMMSTEETYYGICFESGLDLDIPLFETIADAKEFISDFDRPVSHLLEFTVDTSKKIW
jgi:hypothetical protein